MQHSFPTGSAVKNSPFNAGDAHLIPGSKRSSGEENGNSLQYSCLGELYGQRNLAGCNPWGRRELNKRKLSTEELLLLN